MKQGGSVCSSDGNVIFHQSASGDSIDSRFMSCSRPDTASESSAERNTLSLPRNTIFYQLPYRYAWSFTVRLNHHDYHFGELHKDLLQKNRCLFHFAPWLFSRFRVEENIKKNSKSKKEMMNWQWNDIRNPIKELERLRLILIWLLLNDRLIFTRTNVGKNGL